MGELAQVLLKLNDQKIQRRQMELDEKFRQVFQGPLMKAQAGNLAADTAGRMKDLSDDSGKNLREAQAKALASESDLKNDQFLSDEAFRQKYQAPFIEAQTKYQNALAIRSANAELMDIERQIANNESLIGKEKLKQLRMTTKTIRDGLNDPDPNKAKAYADALAGIKQSESFADVIKLMGLKIDQDTYDLNAMKVASDMQAQELGKYQFLLQGLSNPAMSKFFTEQQKMQLEKDLTEQSFGLPGGSLGTPEKGFFGEYTTPTGGTGINDFMQQTNPAAIDPNMAGIDPNMEAALQGLR